MSGYDPELDEPKYSERDMRRLTDAINRATSRLLAWRPGVKYQPGAVCWHGRARWIAVINTSSEPGRTGAWSRQDDRILPEGK